MDSHKPTPPTNREHGLALIALLAVIGVVGLFFLAKGLSASQMMLQRDATDMATLKQAKEALIAYAVSRVITTGDAPRPGDLPCPDTTDDGDKENTCGNASGSTGQASRLGRLPWRTLGLPDLRDSSGERLWYAVSNSFKENTRHNPLNSETPGTITVRDASGTIVFDGSGTSGAVAVIIAPGAPLPGQVRSTAGINTASNYLDTALGENNAAFIDGNSDGFIMGPIRDVSGTVLLNDRILVISRDDIMAAIEKRVAAEVAICLTEYAAANHDRYPWAAPLNSALAPAYADVANARFGRVPDTPFSATSATTGPVASGGMDTSWTGSCNIASSSGWWDTNTWKEMVFYALADAYKPVPAPMPAPACGVTGTCLTVSPPSAAATARFVVLVAGRALSGQSRATNADKGTLANYHELENANGDDTFSALSRSNAFNDSVVFR